LSTTQEWTPAPPTVPELHVQAVARGARPALPSGRGPPRVAPDGAASSSSATSTSNLTTVTWIANVFGTGTGTVSSDPSGLSCTGPDVTCAGALDLTTVTLTATPASGHTFAGWGGACTGTSATCVVSVTVAKTVVATFNGPGALTYYHADVLGSVRAITDAEGDPVTRHDYAPFGESTSDLDGDPRRYLGQELDAETAFDHFGARQYRNVWGRFTGIDPIFSAGAATNPQLWNRYAYALNGPLRYSDPSGLEPEDSDDKSGTGGQVDDVYFVSSQDAMTAFFVGQEQLMSWASHNLPWPGAGGAQGRSLSLPSGCCSFAENPALILAAAAIMTRLAPLVAGGLLSLRLGQIAERAVRMSFNIGDRFRFSVDNRWRIADGMVGLRISEVKNVRYLGLNQQIRDYVTFSQRNGLEFNLYVRFDTRLSRPLEQAVTSGLINLRRVLW
jgi:RHS repeat-associated protein/uncharacterized repeat protein (TIGR02543 family)